MAEHPAGDLVLKWLIEQDATLAEAGREERFSRILVDTVGTETMKSWVRVNRGAMVLCRRTAGVQTLLCLDQETPSQSARDQDDSRRGQSLGRFGDFSC
ncbi:hypothetical protein ILYODFUR_034427 [Ilyodon furcidens]|uniref:Uncharacterized protein n=1 Tax=Ilyodon furcidens TaxID=33524 RepID=A0ABV0V0H4_9TELE